MAPPSQEMDVLLAQIANDMKQCSHLVPTVKQLTDAVALLRTDRDNQESLRRQGNAQIREANKNMRIQADFWKRQAEKHQKKSDAKDQMILECHSMLVEVMKQQLRAQSKK